jgi:ribosomal protein S18 acetylase RimI-like enzyme
VRAVDVRPAIEKDLPSLVILAEEFMPAKADNQKRMGMLKQTLGDSNHELLVAELEGEIIGFMDHWFIDDFVHEAKLGYIQNLYVDSQHRRRGVASKLLRKAMENARNRGVSEIHVTTRFENKLAINLYRKHGLVKEHLQLEKEY